MIAGIDFSTREIHLVRRQDGQVGSSWRKISLPSFTAFAEPDAMAARALRPPLIDTLESGWWDDVWLAGIEYPFTSPDRMRSLILKTILGALIVSIPDHVHVLAMPARLWQPWFLRERLAEPLPKLPRKSIDRKPLIKARALALLESDDIWPQDAYDAFGISWAVELYNRPALGPTPPPAPRMVRPAA